MQDLFELTPELLLEQSQEMSSLCAAYENLFAKITSDLKGMNKGWSDFLANNFSGKIDSAQKTFSGSLTMLHNSAQSVRMVAESSREMDDTWASKITGALSTAMVSGGNVSTVAGDKSVEYEQTDVGDFCKELSKKGRDGHAEYALLCQIFQDMESENGKYSDSVLEAMFKNRLKEHLSPNDPLYNISVQQLQVTRMESGLAALTIRDGENAIVIFAGTDFSKLNDVATDFNILMGSASVQSIQAHQLIANLSKECPNIVVTGHSLGGYLATATTLMNDSVSECIAFDPPGRLDALVQQGLNNERASKVITYTTGSPVSSNVLGHRAVGNVEPLTVDAKGNFHRHGIKQICDALGGKEAVHGMWDNA